METQNLKSSTQDKTLIRALIYGAAGTRKTTLAGTFPKLLFFDFDNKLDPLYGKNIEVIQYLYEDPSECGRLWAKFWRDFKDAKKSDFQTLVFDSLSSMDPILLAYMMILAGKDPKAPCEIQIYGNQKRYYETFLNELKAIKDKNVLLIGHHQEVRDDDGAGQGILLEVCPLITGNKIKPQLPAAFKDVWYMHRPGGEKDDVILHYKPYRKAIANSLSLHGSGEIVNPTYDIIRKEMEKK